MCYQKKYGTYDLVGEKSIIWKKIINEIEKLCELYNFKYIKTPIFESTDLFFDMIGENTDIISKELYNFYDKNNEHIALRPEGTTGVIRSYIENKIYLKEKTSKFYYYGSMFRQEEVENGRFREFQQFGVEVFDNNDYINDVEVISLAVNIFKHLGLNDITVYINNLGSVKDKEKYEKDIRIYLEPYLNLLCDDCKKRFNDNPIRILDCKKDKRRDFIVNAPKIKKYVNKESKDKFNTIINTLDDLKINYIINENLVRGLNYYTDTVFEIKTSIEGYGSINTICGGGRYNNSVKTDSNKKIPALGFAIGLERLIHILELKNKLNIDENMIDFNLNFEDFELLLFLRNINFISDFKSCNLSKYTIDKLDEKYIFYDNINHKKRLLSKENLIKHILKIKKNS